jgi:FAD/FMN-containing dehydrogenase
MTATSTPAALDRALRPLLGERLIPAGHHGFAAARQIWNAAVTRQPSAIARCVDVAEISAAVRATRAAGLPLSVRAGGHDWAGRALRDGGLVIDVSGMDTVEVDPVARTATVGGGATVAGLMAAAGPHGLATPTALVGTVGMAGLTLAGGYGPLNGRHGLSLDNLLAADVVLADGRRVTAGAGDGDDAELFWALRGGGTNFGVVTGLTYRLHDVPAVLAGMILFPLEQAETVLRGYQAFLDDAPDDITVVTGFVPGPAGRPLAFVCPFYSGADLEAGRTLIGRLEGLGTPIVSQVAPMPYADALRMFDAGIVEGNRYLLRSRTLPGLYGDAPAALTAAARDVTSPYSVILLHDFHGAATRPGRSDTAFGLRSAHLVVEIIAIWTPADEEPPHRAWADRTSEALAPMALPGGYPNLLGPDDTGRVRLAYGPNYERLIRAKCRYDPAGVFSGVPTLPPADLPGRGHVGQAVPATLEGTC